MRARERGATAVVVAAVLALLCGFVALALDIGHVLSVRGELQNGADSGALAGVRRLNGTNREFELPGAVADARQFARSHPTDTYDVEPTTIQLGAWMPEADPCPANTVGVPVRKYGYKLCEISARTEEAAADINAIRVVTSREGPSGAAGGGAVELAFGPLAGRTDPANVAAEAIAVSGGPCNSRGCGDLPVAIKAGCMYRDGRLRCDDDDVGAIYYIGLSPAPDDTAGLTSLSDSTPASASNICDILRQRNGCTPLAAGEEINIQNGNSWSSACAPGCPYQAYTSHTGFVDSGKDSMCEVMRWMADRNCDGVVDDSDGDGIPDFRRQVPVVRYPGEDLETCPGVNYNQQAEIVGVATVAIVSVRCETAGKLPFDTAPITRICDDFTRSRGSFSGELCMAVQTYCDVEDDEVSRVGCGWYGTLALEPVLVR